MINGQLHWLMTLKSKNNKILRNWSIQFHRFKCTKETRNKTKKALFFKFPNICKNRENLII